MTDPEILALCVGMFMLCCYLEVLVKLDQRGRERRKAERFDALRNKLR